MTCEVWWGGRSVSKARTMRASPKSARMRRSAIGRRFMSQETVISFDVSVGHTSVVEHRQGDEELMYEDARGLPGKRSGVESCSKRWTHDAGHHDVDACILAAVTEYLHGVRMLKLGTDPRFADQPGTLLRVAGVGDLDSNWAAESRITGPEDRAGGVDLSEFSGRRVRFSSPRVRLSQDRRRSSWMMGRGSSSWVRASLATESLVQSPPVLVLHYVARRSETAMPG